MSMQEIEKYQEEVQVATYSATLSELVVFNDDFNTFDHVIKTLVRVCKHTQEQAEQCTWLIHHKGKCAVKSGSKEDLLPMREGITESGIDARII